VEQLKNSQIGWAKHGVRNNHRITLGTSLKLLCPTYKGSSSSEINGIYGFPWTPTPHITFSRTSVETV